MPVEPPPTRWLLTPPPDDDPEDLAGIGADLAPGTLLSAYRCGLFPMHVGGADDERVLGWWSPYRRGVLPLDGLVVSRSLRRSVRRYAVTVDRAFDDVVRGCADPDRNGAWINDQIRAAYLELHRLGWAHSVEAWSDGQLVGGLYGVAVGGLFAGESMFSRAADASKVALVHLVEVLGGPAAAAEGRLLDVQWQTEHLATLGVVEVGRADYRARLAAAVRLPLPPLLDRPVSWG